MEKEYQTKLQKKKIGVVITSEEIKFQVKSIKQYKEGYLLLIKGIIHQDYKTVIKLHGTISRILINDNK